MGNRYRRVQDQAKASQKLLQKAETEAKEKLLEEYPKPFSMSMDDLSEKSKKGQDCIFCHCHFWCNEAVTTAVVLRQCQPFL